MQLSTMSSINGIILVYGPKLCCLYLWYPVPTAVGLIIRCHNFTQQGLSPQTSIIQKGLFFDIFVDA